MILLALLAGCANVGYQWRREGIVADYYRWIVTGTDEFALSCGFIPPDRSKGYAACAIRLNKGIVMPADRRIDSGEVAGKRFQAPLCVVYGTLDEEEARRMWVDGESLFDHEVMRHCRGEVHQ